MVQKRNPGVPYNRESQPRHKVIQDPPTVRVMKEEMVVCFPGPNAQETLLRSRNSKSMEPCQRVEPTMTSNPFVMCKYFDVEPMPRSLVPRSQMSSISNGVPNVPSFNLRGSEVMPKQYVIISRVNGRVIKC